MANKNQPFIIARVPLDNSEGIWLPGQLLTGSVVTHQVAVNLVIDNRAFQYVEGKKLIFVTNKGGYETRELTLGQTDEQFSQVISGLKVGEQYALSNSYLLKADLGKAGAAHAH
jgi:cobalt-zinc-cadmium efflux system membrane fusion protein